MRFLLISILNKLIEKFHNINNIKSFSRVNCNYTKIKIGPEYNKNFVIKYPENLTIEDYTVINGNCFINALGGVKIGKYCHIAKNLTIYSHNHNWNSNQYIPYDKEVIKKPVTISDFVWIGSNVTITPGVTIGEGSIIGAGAVVSKDIKKGGIAVGNPAKVIKNRDLTMFDKLKNEKKYF